MQNGQNILTLYFEDFFLVNLKSYFCEQLVMATSSLLPPDLSCKPQ